MQSLSIFPRSIRANNLNWTRFAKLIGAKTTGKMYINFTQRYISVTDRMKKSIFDSTIDVSGTVYCTFRTRYGGLNQLWNQKLI